MPGCVWVKCHCVPVFGCHSALITSVSVLVCDCTCMKLNSLQLTVLATEGSEVTASRESSPRAMIPTERYSSILHTSASTHESSTPSFTWIPHKYYKPLALQPLDCHLQGKEQEKTARELRLNLEIEVDIQSSSFVFVVK